MVSPLPAASLFLTLVPPMVRSIPVNGHAILSGARSPGDLLDPISPVFLSPTPQNPFSWLCLQRDLESSPLLPVLPHNHVQTWHLLPEPVASSLLTGPGFCP